MLFFFESRDLFSFRRCRWAGTIEVSALVVIGTKEPHDFFFLFWGNAVSAPGEIGRVRGVARIYIVTHQITKNFLVFTAELTKSGVHLGIARPFFPERPGVY